MWPIWHVALNSILKWFPIIFQAIQNHHVEQCASEVSQLKEIIQYLSALRYQPYFLEVDRFICFADISVPIVDWWDYRYRQNSIPTVFLGCVHCWSGWEECAVITQYERAEKRLLALYRLRAASRGGITTITGWVVNVNTWDCAQHGEITLHGDRWHFSI